MAALLGTDLQPIESRPNHESGLMLGLDSVRQAWLHLRNALRSSGVNSMEDLSSAVRTSRPAITAWANGDSRFQGVSTADDHFNVNRGAYLQDFIQEWVLVQAEQQSGFQIATIPSANFQEAVLAAAVRQTACTASDSTSSGIGGFVRGADLVTEAGWQNSAIGSNGGVQRANGGEDEAEEQSPHGENSSDRASVRRRLNSGSAAECRRVFCPAPTSRVGASDNRRYNLVMDLFSSRVLVVRWSHELGRRSINWRSSVSV